MQVGRWEEQGLWYEAQRNWIKGVQDTVVVEWPGRLRKKAKCGGQSYAMSELTRNSLTCQQYQTWHFSILAPPLCQPYILSKKKTLIENTNHVLQSQPKEMIYRLLANT